MSSESYEICNNYQIYSPGEIWTIYFQNVKIGDTITFENYYTINKNSSGIYIIDNGNKITNIFGKEIKFPNNNPPSGNNPCGFNNSSRCYLMEELIPQAKGNIIHTSTDTKISMNNFQDNGDTNNCITNNFIINYAPSGIPQPTLPALNNFTDIQRTLLINKIKNGCSDTKYLYKCKKKITKKYFIILSFIILIFFNIISNKKLKKYFTNK